MNTSPAQLQPLNLAILNPQTLANTAWFCIRTQSKREHIAAAWLTLQKGIEVCLPRIRFRRPLKRGPVWFTDALFPNYLFARFDLAKWVQKIDFAPAVHGIVRFGAHCPTIPDIVIESLRASIGPDQLHVINEPLHPGERVKLTGGAFHGLQAVVTRVMPGRDRVGILLDFLGRQTKVELAGTAVIRIEDERWKALR